MNKKILGIVAAVVMAVVGTGLLVLYVQGAEDRALEGEQLVRVLTVTQAVPAGTPAAQLEDLVEPEDVPQKIAPEGVISDLVSVSGLVTSVDLVPGEVMVVGRFVEPGDVITRRGSVAVPEGLLEVTVAMSQEQFIGGLPVPGDSVAVIALGERDDFIANDPLAAPPEAPEAEGRKISKIVIQQALVTNVQGNPLPEGAAAAQTATDRVAAVDGSVLVTLAVSGPDAERLIYVRNAQTLNANLHMALHSGDTPVPSTGISVENVISAEAPVG